ncbi:MAG: F0F1 ATP synthase subunit B [Fimbriimonadaceae bacterium]|nr:F0F1 ATP synthase subunit B [Fimbriimonadaceae bacterium]
MITRRRTQLGAISPGSLIWVVVGLVLVAVGGTVFKDTAPPLLEGIDFNLGKMLTQMGVVLVLLPVINIFFVKPLSEAINERNSELEKTFTEAEQLRSKMDAMRSEYEQRLASTEARAREQIQTQIREAQTLRTTLMAEASAKADELVEKARQEIEQEKNKVLSEVRLHVTHLTLGATERILGKNVDSDTNRKLVQEFIDQVEVPS